VVGTVRATAKSEFRLSVARNDYFSRDRERLCLTMTDVKTGGLELTLCETSKARLPLRDAYQKALKTSDDIEVVLEGRDGTPRTLLVGSLDLQARRVTLSELSKSPLALLRHSEPGPACETHECHLELSAFEVTPELTVLVVVTAGESCGAKCSQFAEGQIWTLDREGFRRGADLPATDEMPGGLTYGGRISHTNLCWTEADGAPPLEILVAASESGKEETNLSVVGFDPATRTYSFTEAQPPVRGDAYQTYCGSPLAEF
jgi:hypothetical protein